MDILLATHRIDIARQSVSDAVREGLLNSAEASSLRRFISRTSLVPSSIDERKPGEGDEAAAS